MGKDSWARSPGVLVDSGSICIDRDDNIYMYICMYIYIYIYVYIYMYI